MPNVLGGPEQKNNVPTLVRQSVSTAFVWLILLQDIAAKMRCRRGRGLELLFDYSMLNIKETILTHTITILSQSRAAASKMKTSIVVLCILATCVIAMPPGYDFGLNSLENLLDGESAYILKRDARFIQDKHCPSCRSRKFGACVLDCNL